MTRETKIGLLVGLAFIIVIGILLSDHLTSSTEPPQAALSRVGEVSRQGTQVIGKPEVPVTVEAPAQVTPDRPIVTVEQLNRPKAADIVQFGDATPPRPFPLPPQAEPLVTKLPDPTGVAPPAVDPNLAKLAQQHGEELTLSTPGQPTKLAPNTPENNPTSGMLKYTAAEGDSLSRMAAKFLGGNTKANRDLIVKANPTLVANPDKIVVGRSYLIPTAAAGAPAQQVGTTSAAKATIPVNAPGSVTPAADGQFVFYTVKENDSLWTIARDQLGTGNAWKDIKDWNKDVLKGGDTVHANMRLRLKKSAGATASASARD